MDSSLSLEELLEIETNLNNKNSLKVRAVAVWHYDDVKYKEILSLVNTLPVQFVEPLLDGLEIQIKAEILEEKERRKVELRKLQNKNLGVYSK